MKPQSSYQDCYNYEDGSQLLVVLKGEKGSPIYFVGKPEDYDGTATEPASPTGEYIKKHEND
jgi:hypothetical protein